MQEIILNIWSQFNNRERAALVWILIIGFVLLLKKDIRKSCFDATFSKNTLQLLFPVITYNFLIIYFLYIYGFWNISFFKDSLYWIFGYSLVIFYRIADVDKGMKFLSKMVFSTFSIVAIVAFLGSIYPLSFFKELILQPMLIFLGLMSSLGEFYAEKNPGYEKVAKFFQIILLGLGIFLVVRLLFIILYEYEKLFNLQNLYFFLFPVVLSVLYMPFIYGLRLIMNYENLFIRINPNNGGGHKNVKAIKRGIVKFCHFNLNKLNKFSDFFGRNYFLQEKPNIDDLILKFKKQS